MEKGLVRSILTVFFVLLMFTGPFLAGLCGFLFTGWSIAHYGLSGMQEAFAQKEYLELLKHAVPFIFIKTFTLGAGFIGFALGWIPGYAGLVFLERHDQPVSIEDFYLYGKRR